MDTIYCSISQHQVCAGKMLFVDRFKVCVVKIQVSLYVCVCADSRQVNHLFCRLDFDLLG